MSMSNQPPQTAVGIDRRRFLQAGSMTLVGLGSSALSETREAQAESSLPQAPTFGRAKSVVILYLYVAPSQRDTLDPKPDAPLERRGEFKTISTSLPGIAACELLPNIARNLHRVALVRSMTMYHLLGFDPHQTTIPDRLGRPVHLIPHGDVVHRLLL